MDAAADIVESILAANLSGLRFDSAVAGINHHGAEASDAARTGTTGQKNDGNGQDGNG